MTRRICGALVALALAACGPGASGGREEGAVRFALAANAQELEGYRALVSAYEDATGAPVQLTPSPTRDDLMAKLTTSISGGDPPDVFLSNWRSYGQFAALGALEAVQPYLDRSEALDEEDFAPEPLAAFRYDGDTLTCMPQNTSSLVVYYNADLFAEHGLDPPREGWTWDDLVASARALTEGDVYGLGVEPQLIRLAPFVWSNGGDLVDDPERPTRLDLEDGPARVALEWFLDLSLEHGIVPPDRAEQAEHAGSRFLNGRLGMLVSSRVAVPTLRTIEAFAWDVGPLPRPVGRDLVTILHADAYCIAAASTQKDAAWDLVEFAMGQRGQEILARSGRIVPSRPDVARSSAFLQPDEPPASSEVFLANVERARTSPTIGSWPLVEEIGDDILADLFYGRIDRDTGIRRLHEATDPLFEQVPSR